MLVKFNEIKVGEQFLADNGNGKPVVYERGYFTIMKTWKEGVDYNAKQVETKTLRQFEDDEEVIKV